MHTEAGLSPHILRASSVGCGCMCVVPLRRLEVYRRQATRQTTVCGESHSVLLAQCLLRSFVASGIFTITIITLVFPVLSRLNVEVTVGVRNPQIALGIVQSETFSYRGLPSYHLPVGRA